MSDQLLKNNEIDARTVRVVSETGGLGIMPTTAALRLAGEKGLDLVLIQPDGDPPVCRLMDYSKFLYDQKKRAKEVKKKQHKVELKQLKFSPIISDHDLSYRIKQAKGWLSEGNKVKFTVEFMGRQRQHLDIGQTLLNKIISQLGENIAIDSRSISDDRRELNLCSCAPGTQKLIFMFDYLANKITTREELDTILTNKDVTEVAVNRIETSIETNKKLILSIQKQITDINARQETLLNNLGRVKYGLMDGDVIIPTGKSAKQKNIVYAVITAVVSNNLELKVYNRNRSFVFQYINKFGPYKKCTELDLAFRKKAVWPEDFYTKIKISKVIMLNKSNPSAIVFDQPDPLDEDTAVAHDEALEALEKQG